MSSQFRIAGKTTLNGAVQQATLRLYEAVTGDLRAEVESDAGTGDYEFEGTSNDDPIVMQSGEEYFILCDYGSGVRPLAHGPITPEVIES